MRNETSTVNRPPRSIWFTVLLYPDNPNHMRFFKGLDTLCKQWFGILHDKDVWLLEDNSDDVDDTDLIGAYNHVVGELKKAHYHIVMKMHRQMTLSAFGDFCERCGVEPWLSKVAYPEGMARYLTHSFEPEKYQYDDAFILGDRTLYASLTGSEDARLEHFLGCIGVIREYGYDFTSACVYLKDQNLFDLLTRSYIYVKMVENAVKVGLSNKERKFK